LGRLQVEPRFGQRAFQLGHLQLGQEIPLLDRVPLLYEDGAHVAAGAEEELSFLHGGHAGGELQLAQHLAALNDVGWLFGHDGGGDGGGGRLLLHRARSALAGRQQSNQH
jgi:hypothetical protein